MLVRCSVPNTVITMSKRERYERANMRGGLGVRKRMSEESLRDTYRLNGVRSGFAVARCYDKYGRWELGYTPGIIVRKTASVVQVRWADDPDNIVTYDQGDARYEIDRGRWRVLGLVQGNPLDPDNPLALALTQMRQSAIIDMPAEPGTPPTEEIDEEMSEKLSKAAQERAAAQHAMKNGSLPDRETYTAKQIATRCGTDPKTMRKFFRSSNSTTSPVGQGGRYEFDAKDVPTIMREFSAWRKKATSRPPKPEPKLVFSVDLEPEHDIPLSRVADAIERAQDEPGDIDAYTISFSPDSEPTDEEILAMEAEELDIDEIDED